MQICIPRILNDDGAISVLRDIEKNRTEQEIGYSFSDVGFVLPSGTLMLADKIRLISCERRENGLANKIVSAKAIEESKEHAIGYLKYFGFFKYIGVPIGSDYNREVSKSSYLPINTISINDLTVSIGKGHWTDSIERKCEKLASIISRNIQTSIQIAYCFREIIRNVFEHSASDRCTIMAQYYPSTNYVEMSINDCGMGIVTSLRTRYGNSIPSVELLERALLPGISSGSHELVDSHWGNSGFGLYILSEFGKRYGEFVVISNGIYLKYYEQNKRIVIDKVPHKGTMVKLKIKLDDVDYFPNILRSIVHEGEDLTERLFGKRIKASSISKKSGSE